MQTEGALFWALIIGGITWLVILFAVFRGIACRKDLNMIGKALWLVVIFMAPILGLIAYIAFGKKDKDA